MVVITLTDCPQGLRGDLTKWLLEIHPSVFVGQISTRVRENLWKRIQEMSKQGKVIMVYSTNGEQHLDFRVSGGTWEPIDFDGIKLMLRPSRSQIREGKDQEMNFSHAAARRIAKHMASENKQLPKSYVVIDLETTGFNEEDSEIIEIGAVKVNDGIIVDTFSVLLQAEKSIPEKIIELTGITAELLENEGIPLQAGLTKFFSFIGEAAVVAHNADFDRNFLRAACNQCSLPLFSNRSIDTLSLSKRIVKGLSSYKLNSLANHFGIIQDSSHRSLTDCYTTQQLYEKLNELLIAE